MGEAEDIVRRQGTEEQRLRKAVADAAAAETRLYIRGKLQRMLPLAVANLRKHNYEVPNRTWVTVDGEQRVAWSILSVPDPTWEHFNDAYWYLLADGTIVEQCQGKVTRRTTVPSVDALVAMHSIIIHPKVRKMKGVIQRYEPREILRKY